MNENEKYQTWRRAHLSAHVQHILLIMRTPWEERLRGSADSDVNCFTPSSYAVIRRHAEELADELRSLGECEV